VVEAGSVGKPASAESLGRFCGADSAIFPPQIGTSKRYAFVHFKSDHSVAQNGFRNGIRQI
jgi:hypothetical protein